ncbi:hypothetical protein FRB99_000745, partial [Tulasnella sp. 403]
MSVPSNLLVSARSSYRQLWRASSATFAGDDRVLQAFRQKCRNEFIKGRNIKDERQYQERITLAQEVAKFLRTNVVQAQQEQESDKWVIRMTEDTELGDNMSIKNPKPVECSGSKARRKRAEAAAAPLPDTSLQVGSDANANDLERTTEHLGASRILDNSEHPFLGDKEPPRVRKHLHYAALVKAHKDRLVPQFQEEDIEETFIRGSGPGGQATNKTSNNVSLLHKPTGIRVTCHQTRSQATNRRIARKMLLEKLDQLQNPGLTKEDVKRSKERERKRQKAKKARKKQRLAE